MRRAPCVIGLTIAVIGSTISGCAHEDDDEHGPAAAPRASTLVADLQAAGLDLDALPESPRMLAGDLRDKVMQSFNDALGVECSDCHRGTDYITPTEKSQIALGMWKELVAQLQLQGGKPLYCDSCHQGHEEFLDRKSDDELAAWMNENFVDKLERRDGSAHGCASCHGDPFTAEIFELWGNPRS